jgi:LysR family transcriptional regulator for bpeEF and oprC
MDCVQAMKVFARVVESNSFTRAADTLDLSRASVTLIVQQLEAHLKVRLLQRTTRRLSLTPDGAAYYERSVRILADIDEMEHSFADTHRTPHGKLRVDMPGSIGRLIVMPRLWEFHARYPDIDLMIGFGDRPVDLIQEGVDCVIRAGALKDSTLVARRIGVYRSVTVASPDYLARHGEPTSIEDLRRHHAVNYLWSHAGRLVDLSFVVDDKPVEVRMASRISANDTEAYLASALSGAGLAQLARFVALAHLRNGELVAVLPQWHAPPLAISAVYSHTRHLAAAVRVFVDWIAELFEGSALLASASEAGDSGLRTQHSASASQGRVELLN